MRWGDMGLGEWLWVGSVMLARLLLVSLMLLLSLIPLSVADHMEEVKCKAMSMRNCTISKKERLCRVWYRKV
jgi:hypothetical protein